MANADEFSHAPETIDVAVEHKQPNTNILDQLLEENKEESPLCKREGVFVASFVSFDDAGAPFVVVPGVISQPKKADAICDMSNAKKGEQYGVMFKNGDAEYPTIMGKMQQQTVVAVPEETVQITEENQQLRITSKKEIHLQCGDSHLLLSPDGRVEIRGKTVVTHSTGLNKMRGASVKIN